MKRRLTAILAFALPLLVPAGAVLAGVTASFRYPLSNFSGPVRSQWAQLAIDRERNEVYALHQRKNDIRIFDEHGMEIFVFGDGFASAADIAVGEGGDIFVLSMGYDKSKLHLMNYRGERVADIPLSKVPKAFSEILPDRLVYRNGWLYLVDSDALQVVAVDESGRFQKGFDLRRLLKPLLPRDEKVAQLRSYDWKEQRLEYIELNGFTVDAEGSLFFTVPVLFSAYKLTPGGDLVAFGKAGSGKGKFGVAAGIVTDDLGYIYVSDRLRCVVLVFDRDFRFQTEFGYRGGEPSNLIVPDDLAIDGEGNIYVGQAANRGVSVFSVVRDETSPDTDNVSGSDRGWSRKSSWKPSRKRVRRTARKPEQSAQKSDLRRLRASGDRDGQAVRRPARAPAPAPAAAVVEKEYVESAEFPVDRGGADASTDFNDSEESGWTSEEDGPKQLEVTEDEED